MCDQDLIHSLDTLKSLSVKVDSEIVIRDACGRWNSLHTVPSVHSIQKKKKKTVRNSERSYSVDGRRFKRQNRKKIGLISKIARRQWKETMFRLRSWLLLHVKQYKKSCWRTFVIKKCTYLHSASQWSWWRSSVYLPTDLSPTKEIVSTN